MNRRALEISLAAILTVCGASRVIAQNRARSVGTAPITAKLTIPDGKTLPGVPFDMWIDVTNTSDTAVGLGLCADMIVHPPLGNNFTITREGGENRPPYPVLLPATSSPQGGKATESLRYLVMRPHETRTLTIPVLLFFEGPNYFDDERLSPPGSYGISFRLDYCWPGFVVPQDSLLPAEFLGPVLTNEVTVERVSPTGSNGAVWRRMQELSSGHWSATSSWSTEAGGIVKREILSKYPDSDYYPYAVLGGAASGPVWAGALDAIARFPSSPVVELLHELARRLAAQEIAALNDAARNGKAFDFSAAARAAAVERAEREKAQQAKRATSRMVIMGRQDAPDPPCPRGYDCSEP